MSRHSPRCSGLRLFTLAVPVLLVLHAGPAAVADTLIVTDCGDAPGGGGPGQLRRVMNDAGAGDLIMVPACTIFLEGFSGDEANVDGDLDVTKNLTIVGQGAATIIAKGGALGDRIFHVQPGVVATFADFVVSGANWNLSGAGIYNEGELHLFRVTLQQNHGNAGGGVFNETGATLTLDDCTVSGNSTVSGSVGGGIGNRGTLTVTRSRIVQNAAGVFGGGLSNTPPGTVAIVESTIAGNTGAGGGGIYNEGSLTVTNSTISGNRADGFSPSGGGLLNSQSGSATLRRVTLASNTVGPGGGGAGIRNDFGGSTVTLEGTIVAGNACAGQPPTSNGHNLDEGTTCGLSGTGDLTNVGNAKLGALLDNGGPTQTHMPCFDSPAVDAGGGTCAATPGDQRGVTRPQGTACDIGAVEWTDLIFQDNFE